MRLGIRSALLAFLPAMLAAAPASGQAGKSPGACDRAAFRVVLDVGHTPQEPGAISARGVPEFEFNHWLAKRIDAELRGAGFGRTVVLVTNGKTRPGLAQRVSRANALGADLLLSIHHDSVPEVFKSTWEYLGAEGQYSDRFPGHSLFVSVANRQYERSLAFARRLGMALKERGLKYTPHYTEAFMGARRRQLVDREAGVYRFDQLVVLKDMAMPAVLLEAGSIIHRDEELAVQSPGRQARVAAAVTQAVAEYCGARGRRAP